MNDAAARFALKMREKAGIVHSKTPEALAAERRANGESLRIPKSRLSIELDGVKAREVRRIMDEKHEMAVAKAKAASMLRRDSWNTLSRKKAFNAVREQ